MKSTIIAVAAFVAAAVAQDFGPADDAAPGYAHIINKCSYPVYLYDTPAADGGQNESDYTLAANGGTHKQQWTELTNGQGWSKKLTKVEGDLSQIMQYEYTYHADGYIWFDLSDVNGNPWDGDWEITAEGAGCGADEVCTPRQAAYQYATDDAYGMQSCNQTASVTVTLCSGDSDSGSSPSAYSSSSAVASSTSVYSAPSSSYEAPTSTSSYVAPSSTAAPVTTSESSSSTVAPASTSATHSWGHGGYSHTWAHEAVASPATTLATIVAAPSDDSNVLVIVTTEIAYTTVDMPAPTKRSEHHHQHHQHHAARHPHAR